MQLSIIVPVYNAEEWLRECLDSLVAQTLDDFEVILVDDGSADRSFEICQEYAGRDSRFRLIRQDNQGAAAARNTGLSAAQGEFVGFIDSDDMASPDMFEVMVSRCLKEGRDIAWCSTRIIGESRDAPAVFEDEVLDRRGIYETILKLGINNVGMCDKLFARRLFDGFRLPSLVINEDIVAFYELLDRSNGVVTCKEGAYYHRKPPRDSAKSRFTPDKARAIGQNLKTLRPVIARDYPELLPLLKDNEERIAYFMAASYLQGGGSRRSSFYKAIKRNFDRHYAGILTHADLRTGAILIKSGLYQAVWRGRNRLRKN